MSCNNKEWKTVKLKDISTDGKGFYGIGAPAVDFNENLYTYLRITDITDDGRINKDGLKSVADENAKDYLLKKNDIVFARTGNSTGRAYFYNEKDGNLVYAGFLVKFNLDETKVNPKYIKYFTLSPEYKKWVNSFATGSTRKNINAKMFGDMQIELPNREYQNKVVNILEPLSQKIEHNIEMNRTLEEMAQSLFKHWFIDFEFPNEKGEPYKSSGGKFVESELGMIPEGWYIGKLTDIAELIMGQSPKGDTYNFEGKGLGLINGASDFKDGKITPLKYTTDPKKVSKKGDWIFGVRATVGNVTYVDKEYCLGRGVGVARALSDKVREYLYFQLIEGINYLEKTALGSVYINLSKSDLENMKFVIPSKKIIKRFHETVSPLFNKININTVENNNLILLRDNLLPKLMSGEIRIPEAEEAVESCLQKNN